MATKLPKNLRLGSQLHEPLTLARRAEISFSRYELTLFAGHLINGLLVGTQEVLNHFLFLLLVLYQFLLFPFYLVPCSPVPFFSLFSCCFVPLFSCSPVRHFPLFPSFPVQVFITSNSREIK